MKSSAYSGRKIAYLGLLTALAALMGYVEAMIPINFGIPGFKLGLCNLVIVIVLYLYAWREALLVSAARILIIGFLFGNLFSILYSLAGAVLSIATMALLKRTGLFSVIGVSAAGGAAHNLGQLIAACLILPGIPFAAYYPVLSLAGCGAGCAVGAVVFSVGRRLPKILQKN